MIYWYSFFKANILKINFSKISDTSVKILFCFLILSSALIFTKFDNEKFLKNLILKYRQNIVKIKKGWQN